MRNDTIKSQRRQNTSKLIETPKKDSILSSVSGKRYISSNNSRETEYYSKDLLENTRKYLEMSNGNSNNLFSPVKTINDYNDQSFSPTLSENYNFAQKYNEVLNYNNLSSNYLQDEFNNANNNGNDRFDKVKNEYIEYLQNQLEENNKNTLRLESKLNDLQRRFKNLIDDNRLLNDTLNERNSKLNEYIQENENLRLQINNYIENETKYRMQIQYCEKQIGLYENNINDYNNIIKDLKNSNETLTNNLTQSIDNKNNRNNGSSTNNNFNNYNYFNVRNVTSDNDGELQFLKNQNMIYANNIKSKDYTIDFVQKKNEKLMNENKLFRIQIDQYIQQITSLYTILKQSNKIINMFKQKGGIRDNSILKEFDKLEELNINFMNNTLNQNKDDNLDDTNEDSESTWFNKSSIGRGINPSIDKLMTDNEENKKRIEMLNNKIRSLNDPNQNAQNYTEYMKSNNNNTVKVVKASKRESRRENGLINKPEKHAIGLHKDDNIVGEQNRVNNFSRNKKEEEKQNNVKEERKRARFNKSEETNIKNSEDKTQTNKKEEEEKTDATKSNKPKKNIKFAGVLEEKDKDKDKEKGDIKVEVVEPEVERKRSNSSGPKSKKKITIADAIDITVINTALPVISQNLSFSMDDTEFFKNLQKSSISSIYLFGIDRSDDFHTFDLINKKFSKKKILEIEDISDTFKKDYQYDGTILYNTFDGLFILTGKKSDMLYYYNPKYDTINKICQFNNGHDNGSLLLDKESNRLFVFGGKETTKCEYYSFSDKKIYDMPDLIIDRANGAFIICNNKIYGFFGFTYKNNKFCGNIECIDYKKLDKWTEVQDINILNDKINFEVESVSTINYKENKDKILIYAGIQGENEDYVTDYYYLYDTKENSIDLVEKWENRVLRFTGSRWRNSNLTKKDPSGFHFAKNSNFLRLPKSVSIEGYEDDLYLLMDYKNNVHFINQDQKSIDIYKGDVL